MSKISRWRWGMTWAAGLVFLLDLWGVVTHQAWLQSLDQLLISWVRQPLPTPLTRTLIGITLAGNPRPVTWITLLLVAGLLLARRFLASGLLLINVVGWAGLGNHFIKTLVRRPRPTVDRLVQESSFSFPSGHAITVMLLWGTVIVLAAHYLKNYPGWRWTITGLASCWIFLVGVSRVFVGVHYPSDVLGGWLLGFFLLTITQWVLTRHNREL